MNKQIEGMVEVLQSETIEWGKGEETDRTIAEAFYKAGYRKQSEWISVKERLPEKIGTYLVIGKSGTPHTAHFYTEIKIHSPNFDVIRAHFSNRYVRFWMPLPEPPKMKGD